MGEILSYFVSPEDSMGKLLLTRDKDKWKQGLLYWMMIAVLLGFLTVSAYRLNGIGLTEVLGDNLGQTMTEMLGAELNEGIVWLTTAVVSVIQSLIIVGVRFIAWSIMLYLANLILGQKLKIYDIVLLSMFTMVTWLAAEVVTVIAILIASICPIAIINQMVVGISMILDYWYLVLLAIGFAIVSKSTFLKSGMVILVIQGIFWGLGSIAPVLQVMLG